MKELSKYCNLLETAVEIEAVLNEFAYMLVEFQDKEFLKEYAVKLENTAYCIVEHDKNGQNRGIATFYANDLETKVCFVTSLIIKEEAGLSRGLVLSHLFMVGKEITCKQGMEKVRIEVRNNNVSARKMYDKFGFKVERETDHDTAIMIIDLADLHLARKR